MNNTHPFPYPLKKLRVAVRQLTSQEIEPPAQNVKKRDKKVSLHVKSLPGFLNDRDSLSRI